MLKFCLIACLALTVGCAHNAVKETATSTLESAPTPIKEHLVLATLWQQHAAEYKALCYQAYNVAKHRIDWLLTNHPSDKPLAIIADIDETVLDNSPYASQLIQEDINYSSETWIEWGLKESANPVPGALAFYQYAATQGITVFYVSNRYGEQLTETVNNLKQHGFPNAKASHVLLKTAGSGKEPRRQQIMQTHDVVMLLGDNLSDFHQAFDKQSTANRNAIAEKMADQFGHLYIVFPNPTYGDWETKGLYEGKYDWSETEKNKIRLNKLKAY